jgi:hypothetical protein
LPLAFGAEPSGHVCDVDGGRTLEGGELEGGCMFVGGGCGGGGEVPATLYRGVQLLGGFVSSQSYPSLTLDLVSQK